MASFNFSWNSMELLDNYELPDDVYDAFNVMDYHINMQENSETTRDISGPSYHDVNITVSSVPCPIYTPKALKKDLTEQEVLDECVLSTMKLGGVTAPYLIASDGIYDRNKVNVVFIPKRANIYSGGTGRCTTPIGTFSYHYISSRLPDWGSMVSMSFNQGNLITLEECYLLYDREKFLFQYFADVKICGTGVPVTGSKFPEMSSELGIAFSNEGQEWFDIPEGRYTVGLVSDTSIMHYKISGRRYGLAGAFNIGERYLLKIVNNGIVVVAALFPGRSLVESEAMMIVWKKKPFHYERGMGKGVRAENGKFIIFDDFKSLAPLPVDLPPIIPGHRGNTIGYVDGSVEILTDGELKNFIGLIPDAYDHYVPFGKGVVSRSRALMLPMVYKVRSYVGEIPLSNLKLCNELGRGVHSENLKSPYYSKRKIERIQTDIDRLGISGGDVGTKIRHEDYEKMNLYDAVAVLLARFKLVYILDVAYICRKPIPDVVVVVSAGLGIGDFMFDSGSGSIMMRPKQCKETLLEVFIRNKQNVEALKLLKGRDPLSCNDRASPLMLSLLHGNFELFQLLSENISTIVMNEDVDGFTFTGELRRKDRFRICIWDKLSDKLKGLVEWEDVSARMK